MTTKPSAARVAAHRARKAAAGLAEVRGIWAPPEMHDAIRAEGAYIAGRSDRLRQGWESSRQKMGMKCMVEGVAYLSKKQAADALGITRQQLNRKLSAGKLNGFVLKPLDKA